MARRFNICALLVLWCICLDFYTLTHERDPEVRRISRRGFVRQWEKD